MDNEINKTYVEDKQYSFGGKCKVYHAYAKKDVGKALQKSDIYSRFKQHRRAKTFSPIYVYSKRELFQSDTVFLQVLNWSKLIMGINICLQPLMYSIRWLGCIP